MPFLYHIFNRLKVFWGRLDQFFGPSSSGAWPQWHLCKKNGSNRPRLAPAARKLAKSQHRALMLCKPKTLDPDFSRIRQKFKILIQLKVLDFGPNSKTTKKIQIGGDAKKGQKKVLWWCVPLIIQKWLNRLGSNSQRVFSLVPGWFQAKKIRIRLPVRRKKPVFNGFS